MSQYRIIKDTSVKPNSKERSELRTAIYLRKQEIIHLEKRRDITIKQKELLTTQYWQRVKHEHKFELIESKSGYHKGRCYQCKTIAEWFV